MPPNVNFSEGLTPDKVTQGPPRWAGQVHPSCGISSSHGTNEIYVSDSENKGEGKNTLVSPRTGEAQTTARRSKVPDPEPQRMQVQYSITVHTTVCSVDGLIDSLPHIKNPRGVFNLEMDVPFYPMYTKRKEVLVEGDSFNGKYKASAE